MATGTSSNVNILRITHKELTELSEHTKSKIRDDDDDLSQHSTDLQQKKDIKRPTRELYRPGKGRLQKSPRPHAKKSLEVQQPVVNRQSDLSRSQLTVDDTHKDHSDIVDESSLADEFANQTSLSNNSSDHDKNFKNRSKRPDQVIYVPKHKANACPGSIHSSDKDSKVDSDIIESMVITNSKMTSIVDGQSSKVNSSAPQQRDDKNLRVKSFDSANAIDKNVYQVGNSHGRRQQSSSTGDRITTPVSDSSDWHRRKKHELSYDNRKLRNENNAGSSRNKRQSKPRNYSERNAVNRTDAFGNNQIGNSDEESDREIPNNVNVDAKMSEHCSEEDLKDVGEEAHSSSEDCIEKYVLKSSNWAEIVEAAEREQNNNDDKNSEDRNRCNEEHPDHYPVEASVKRCGDELKSETKKLPEHTSKGKSPVDGNTRKNYSSERRGSIDFNRRRKQKPGVSSKKDGRLPHTSVPHREQYVLPPRFERQKQLARLNQQEKHEFHCDDVRDSSVNTSGSVIRIPPTVQNLPVPTSVISPPSVCSVLSSSSPPNSEMIQRQLFNPNHPNTPTKVMMVKPFRDSNKSLSSPSDHADAVPNQQPQLMQQQPQEFNPTNVPSPNMPYPVQGFPNVHPMPSQMMYAAPPHHPVSLIGTHSIPPNNWSARTAQAIIKNMREAMGLEQELNMLLSRGLHITDFNTVRQCIWKIQVRYETVILSDPEICTRQNVEQLLWKAAFYQLIEALRRVISDDPSYVDDARNKLLKVIEEGTVFYESLLEKQQESFGFTLSEFLDCEAVRPRSLPPMVKLALVSAQKTLICLGDLARYKEQANLTSNFGRAKSWYMKAQQIAPKNGRPYNQLAILALCARRKLDAVYYYMRSLAASNPFLTARESLLSLFDDARKKYEQVARKQAEKGSTSGAENQQDKSLSEEKRAKMMERLETRVELWIRPDGSSIKCEQEEKNFTDNNADDVDSTDEYTNMSTVELNKKFVLSFLHVHGKLFTKIGMESLSDVACDMLKQFRGLLNRTPTAIGSSRLIQLMAINMFAIFNTSLKDTSLEASCRSLVQEQALNISMEMLSLLLERTVILLKEHTNSDRYPVPLLFSDDLQQLVPAIKVWTDWMVCNQHVWTPPISTLSSDMKSGCKSDFWQLLAQLSTLVRIVDVSHVHLLQDDCDDNPDTELLVLSEDSSLAGFVPLMTAPENFTKVRTPVDKEQARNALRINKLQFFGDYLCGISPPALIYDVENESYLSAVTDSADVEETETSSTGNVRDEPSRNNEINEDIRSSSEEEDDDGGGELRKDCDDEIKRLWSRKEQLKKKKARQDKRNAQIQAVLDEHHKKQPMMLSIKPKMLIADTNTYIDHIDGIKKLADSGYFQLLVPLVVLGELDGLAKGTKSNKNECKEEANSKYKSQVAQNAQNAVTYLEERFNKKDNHIKAMTARGSILDTIAFRSEDNTDTQMTNDDIILTCCLHLCHDDDKDASNTDAENGRRIFRRVVLLTDDRNLRLKAHTQDVPTKSFTSFLCWALIT